MVSYSDEKIIGRSIRAINDGATQLWLTSEDLGAYGLDQDENSENSKCLSELINKLIKEIEKNPKSSYPDGSPRVMIRLGMTNPPYILDQIDELKVIFENKHVFKFLHIPVQSGSNDVLNNMIRDYTIEDFCQILDSLKENQVRIATDIICGFPYETDADHQQTLDLIEKYQIPTVNISQYYPRPGTMAFKMKQIPKNISKSRTKDVTNTFNSYKTNDHLKNQTILVHFSDVSDRSNHYVGHDGSYTKVLVDKNSAPDLVGQSALVKIDLTTKWHVEGKIVELLGH